MDDRPFIEAMLPHQLVAIWLADIELVQGMREDVKALARHIKRTHSADAEVLVREIGAVIAPLDTCYEDELLKLEDARGAEVDHLFLDGMIAHHEGGIALAREAVPTLERPCLKALAQRIVEAEGREVARLRALMRASRRRPAVHREE